MMSASLATWVVLLPLIGFGFNAASGLLLKDWQLQRKAVAYVAPGVVLLAFVLALALLGALANAPDHRLFAPLVPGTSLQHPWLSIAGFKADFTLVIDPLSVLMALIITGVGGLIHVYATGYMAEDRDQPRFFTHFNLFIFMMLLLVMANNFLLMYVGWEGVGLCSYLLIGFWYVNSDNARAGNKAFIVNRVGDLGFTLGVLATWSVFGTISFFNSAGGGVMQMAAHPGGAVDALGHPVPQTMLTIICLLLFVGVVGKSAQIPLFVWLPDAMAGPTPISALIHAATMVTAGVVLLVRCSWLYVQSPLALHVVAWVGVLTAFIGATIALVQTDIKRVLAYSTVSQLGYMVLACGVGAFSAGMFHVLTHAFFKALLFLGAGAVIHAMLGEQDMRRMGGLRKYLPAVWGVMLVATYAIAGVPPFSGFFSKDPILDAASRAFSGDGAALYAIGLFTALLTAYYMNRLMWKTFYTEPRFVDGQLPDKHPTNYPEEKHEGEAHGHLHLVPSSMMIPLYILAVLSAIGGLVLGPTGIFERFLAPSVAPLSLGGLQEGQPLFSTTVGYIVSAIVAIIGLSIAAYLYRQHMQTGELLPEEAKRTNLLYRFLDARWEFDAVYEWLFIRGGAQVARFLWKSLDEEIIDGIVEGIGAAVAWVGRTGRRLQTGYVRNYALIMFLGGVILVIGLLAGLMRY